MTIRPGLVAAVAAAALLSAQSSACHDSVVPAGDDQAPPRSFVWDGAWRAGAVVDPEAAAGAAEVDASQALAAAGLPDTGVLIRVSRAEICFAPFPCREVAWRVGTLASEPGGARLAAVLRAPASTPVRVGDLGRGEPLTLIALPDGRLLANFSICGPNATACHNGFQSWIRVDAPDPPKPAARP